MDHQVKYLLDESEMPRQWYNVIPDLPSPPPPPLHPGTRQPVVGGHGGTVARVPLPPGSDIITVEEQRTSHRLPTSAPWTGPASRRRSAAPTAGPCS